MWIRDCGQTPSKDLQNACKAICVLLQADDDFDLIENLIHNQGVPVEMSQINPSYIKDGVIHKLRLYIRNLDLKVL